MKKFLFVLLIFTATAFGSSKTKNISITIIPAVTDHSVTLTWNYDPSFPGTFNVYRQQAGDPAFTQIANSFTVTTFTDTNVVSDITYQYYVTAANAQIESQPSNVVEATIPTP
jgi:fibronectin type 3 domain-containing protein